MLKNKKVMIGLSGGVDSSITAYLLQQEGYEVVGVYMKLHNIIDGYHETNLQAINKVTKFLNITCNIVDYTTRFKKNIYNYFVNSYKDGITPNPCIMCNKDIKFGAMFDYAMKQKCDYLATGHYASTDGKFIYKAKDQNKDQSYFLGQINKDILQKLIFPMSKYTKDEIRDIALKIPAFKEIARKKDSQEICFVENNYTQILKLHENIDIQGNTLDEFGNIIGNHKGYMHYTIGKRRGFYVHGAHHAHYIKNIDPINNTITVCKKEKLIIKEVKINNLNLFINYKKIFHATVKLRYRSTPLNCIIHINDDDNATIKLKDYAFGVACGQVAVFYDKDKIIGSGVIIKTSVS